MCFVALDSSDLSFKCLLNFKAFWVNLLQTYNCFALLYFSCLHVVVSIDGVLWRSVRNGV